MSLDHSLLLSRRRESRTWNGSASDSVFCAALEQWKQEEKVERVEFADHFFREQMLRQRTHKVLLNISGIEREGRTAAATQEETVD